MFEQPFYNRQVAVGCMPSDCQIVVHGRIEAHFFFKRGRTIFLK
jgi:hypothetical protein